jgi:hypothetical protein
MRLQIPAGQGEGDREHRPLYRNDLRKPDTDPGQRGEI